MPRRPSVLAFCALALASGLVHAEQRTRISTTSEGVETELGFPGPSACEYSLLVIKSRSDSGEWNGNPVDTTTTTMLLSSWNSCTQIRSQFDGATTVQDLQVDPGLGRATLRATVDGLDISVDLVFRATDPVVRQQFEYVDHSDGHVYISRRTEAFRSATVSGTLTINGDEFPAVPGADDGSGADIEGSTYRVLEVAR